jgi:putative DNA primase/helicase
MSGDNITALAAWQEQRSSQQGARGGGAQVDLIAAEDIRSERIRWLWAGRIPLRGLTILAGEKGLGKSLLSNACLPAAVTVGQLSGELKGTPSDVLICTAEDDWRSVVKPRLVGAGANPARVHRVSVRDDDGETLLTLPDHVILLEAKIVELRNSGRTVGMLVIDPIGAFLSSDTDSHRDASVRRALAPLAQMAERLDLAVLVVAHLTKDESTKLLNRVNGAGAFVNAARSVMALAHHPDDPDGGDGDERVLVHLRGNWGRPVPSLSARVGEAEIMLEDGTPTTIGCLQITGECAVSVEDLQGRRGDASGDEIEEAIGAALADGPQPSRKVKAEVIREMGCSESTVKRAAARLVDRDELVQESGGFPKTTIWRLGALQSDHSRRNTQLGEPTVGLDGVSADFVSPLVQLAHEPKGPVPLTVIRDRTAREAAVAPVAETSEDASESHLLTQARAWQEGREQ